MIDFRLFNAAVYRNARQGSLCNPRPYIGLQISGLAWRRGDAGQEEIPPLPFLELVEPGVDRSYCYGSDRENYVIQLISDNILKSDIPNHCLVSCGDLHVSVPAFVPLTKARSRHWQRHCERLCAEALSPDPARQLRTRFRICELLNVFIEAAEGTRQHDPVEQFRESIDEDREFQHSLERLSRDHGYSSDHMRRLFVERFGITPIQYRKQQRMALAADLIANSTDDLGTIALKVGFRHSSPFCAAYRKYFGTTPGSDIHRLRQV